MEIKVARAEKLGQPPVIEQEVTGDLSDDFFIAAAAPFLRAVLAEIRRD